LAALFLALPAHAGDVLQVADAQGRAVAEMPFDGGEICLTWAHSVTGGAVADCFAPRDGQLVLVGSYLHDYAAGLGEVAGRGRVIPAEGGGYWIVEIDEPMPPGGLPLRVGPARVGHKLTGAAGVIDLSAHAANSLVTLRVRPD
jgi:hypothetical protein